MNKLFLAFSVIFSLIGTANAQKSEIEKNLQPGIYAKFETTKGNILVMLEADKTPMTVANFVGLAEGKFAYKDKKFDKPFYDGLKFHRVIKDFMIQGGDPLGTGSGDPGYKFPDEIHPDLKHTGPGILSMANSGPATNGSQFFITHKETPWLNGKHTVFGHVIEGQDIVNAIAQDDVMKKVSIIRIGKVYEKWDATAVFNEKVGVFDKIEAEKKAKYEKIAAMSQDEYKKMLFDNIVKTYPTAKQTASGLIYIIDNEGTGAKAVGGEKMSVHYTGTLVDGTKFDSSRDRGTPMDFQYKTQRMVPGFEEALGMIAAGGKGKFVLPYYLAYGPSARGPIPAYGDLIFDLEIMSILPAPAVNPNDGHDHSDPNHKH